MGRAGRSSADPSAHGSRSLRGRAPVPSWRAVAAGTGSVKKIHTWAPTPERETSSAAGRADGARGLEVGERVQHRGLARRSPRRASRSGRRAASGTGRCGRRRSDAPRVPRASAAGSAVGRLAPLRQPPSTAGIQPDLPVAGVLPTERRTRRAGRRTAPRRTRPSPAATSSRPPVPVTCRTMQLGACAGAASASVSFRSLRSRAFSRRRPSSSPLKSGTAQSCRTATGEGEQRACLNVRRCAMPNSGHDSPASRYGLQAPSHRDVEAGSPTKHWDFHATRRCRQEPRRVRRGVRAPGARCGCVRVSGAVMMSLPLRVRLRRSAFRLAAARRSSPLSSA